MENKSVFNKTLDDLLYTHQYNYTTKPSTELLQFNIDILKNSNEFYLYLVEQKFDYYELPYVLIGKVGDYIGDCLEKSRPDKAKEILLYLGESLRTGNDNIQELIQVGFLETLDNFKDILPEVLSIMPLNLKQLFMREFSHYLK